MAPRQWHPVAVPALDLLDETFLVAAPARVAAEVARPERWTQWWPDLHLTVFMDRGSQGIRWSVTGALIGSSEIWLEPMLDGVLLHYYLRGDLELGVSAREMDTVRRRRTLQWKRDVWEFKHQLEGERRPGCPRTGGE